MEIKPAKGVKVRVNAQREAIFGEESVGVQKVTLSNADNVGVMTGNVLAGYCEVEMQKLDGRKHWYPIGDLHGENGESVVEEEIPIDLDEDAGDAEE